MPNIINTPITSSDLIQLIGIAVATLTGLVAIIISIITALQNSKMIEESTRPYLVIYNGLINGASTPLQFLIIKNFGQTAATIERLDITPKVDTAYSNGLFENMNGQIIAPSQSYSTAFKLEDSSIVLNASVSYRAGKKKYCDTFSISQKAISDHVHAKVSVDGMVHAQEIIAGCFQDYLRSRL